MLWPPSTGLYKADLEIPYINSDVYSPVVGGHYSVHGTIFKKLTAHNMSSPQPVLQMDAHLQHHINNSSGINKN